MGTCCYCEAPVKDDATRRTCEACPEQAHAECAFEDGWRRDRDGNIFCAGCAGREE